MTTMNSEMEHQSRMNAAIETAEWNLVAVLRPRVFIDGNQWCILYGENLQDGIAGFGDTPYLAALAFGKAMHTTLPSPTKSAA